MPQGIIKQVRDLTDRVRVAAESKGEYRAGTPLGMEKSESTRLIEELEKQMKEAAQNWEFEKAALLRDQIFELRQMLDAQDPRPEWEKVRDQDAQDRERELRERRGLPPREPSSAPEGGSQGRRPRRSFSRGPRGR